MVNQIHLGKKVNPNPKLPIKEQGTHFAIREVGRTVGPGKL